MRAYSHWSLLTDNMRERDVAGVVLPLISVVQNRRKKRKLPITHPLEKNLNQTER